jgi:hypothetical protein
MLRLDPATAGERKVYAVSAPKWSFWFTGRNPLHYAQQEDRGWMVPFAIYVCEQEPTPYAVALTIPTDRPYLFVEPVLLNWQFGQPAGEWRARPFVNRTAIRNGGPLRLGLDRTLRCVQSLPDPNGRCATAYWNVVGRCRDERKEPGPYWWLPELDEVVDRGVAGRTGGLGDHLVDRCFHDEGSDCAYCCS